MYLACLGQRHAGGNITLSAVSAKTATFPANRRTFTAIRSLAFHSDTSVIFFLFFVHDTVNVDQASTVLWMFCRPTAGSFFLLRHDLFENQGAALVLHKVFSDVVFAKAETEANRLAHFPS